MYNQIVLIGNLGNDPELREVAGGIPVTSFRMAVNRHWTTADGQSQEKTNWFNITVWRRQAEVVKQYLTKGRQVMVIGEVSGVRPYTDREGNLRATIDVTASEIRFLDGRRDDYDMAKSISGEPPQVAEDKIPF
jgi:single-strand DNA-binding protein